MNVNVFFSSNLEQFDDSLLYQISQPVEQKARKIVLASGIAILLMAAPIPVAAMTVSEKLSSVEEIVSFGTFDTFVGKTIQYQKPSSESALMTSLLSHKGDKMSQETINAFSAIAKELGNLDSHLAVCRWSTIHMTVATVQKLENGIELRSTWFANRGGRELVFSICHDGEEVFTSRSDVSYLVQQVKEMVEQSSAYV